MKILSNINVLIKTLNNINNLGFVPTMGDLHNGHISLINESQKKCSKTVVSIYVNPRQFNNKNDYSKYPRNLTRDKNILRKLKIDYLFLPDSKEIFKKKRLKKITIAKSQKILCAKFRKLHFEGVLDIMDRFINLIRPRYIFMGEKDYQQLFYVKKYIKDKYLSKVYLCKTIRGKNGIALSSRNNLLSNKGIRSAGLIYSVLKKTKLMIKSKRMPINYLNNLKKELVKKFNVKIEYLEIRNDEDLKVSNNNKKFRLFIAYYIENIRLIDNL